MGPYSYCVITGAGISRDGDGVQFAMRLFCARGGRFVCYFRRRGARTGNMNLYEAAQLAKDLMKQHGLDDWSFSFDHARRRFGQCNYTHRRITLSKRLTFLNPLEEVRDTILHEIAHGLTPGAKHGPRWRAKCREIGARAVRCFTEERVVTPPRRAAPYLLGCPKCEWWVERRRRIRRNYLCTRCGGKVIYRAVTTAAAGKSTQCTIAST